MLQLPSGQLTLLLSRRRNETAMELRRFWLLSDLLEKSPSAKELRRGGFCGGSGAVIFMLLSGSPSPSAACSSMLTNDGMEALAQSLRMRYLPLSMMLMFDGLTNHSIISINSVVSCCKCYAILIDCHVFPHGNSNCKLLRLLCPNCGCQVGRVGRSGRASCPNNGLQFPRVV